MSTSSSPAPSSRIDVVLEPSFWMKHRVTVIGIVVAGSVLVLGIQFMKSRARAGETKGWSAVVNPDFPVQAKRDAIDLNTLQGTTAEPWAMLQAARNHFADYRKSFAVSELDSALALVSDLDAKFSDHPVVLDGMTKSLRTDIEAEKAWAASHPTKIENPQPSDTNKITLVTEHGEIELGLYPDLAPASVASFLDMVRTADKATFRQGNSGYAVTLSADVPKVEGEKKDDVDAKKPKAWGKDRNSLTHLKGAVSFMRYDPFFDSKTETVNVQFALLDDPRRDTQQVVFGVVTKGMDVLEKIAAAEKAESNPSELKSAVKVASVREAAGLANLK